MSLNALITLRNVAKLLREGNDVNDPAIQSLLMSSRRSIESLKKSAAGKPFIIVPSQLDTTQPEDFGYGTPEWLTAYKALPAHLRARKQDFPDKLSHGVNFRVAVLAKKVLYGPHNRFGFMPEYSGENQRRCCFVKGNGMRCKRYGQGPVCSYHYRLVESVPNMSDRFLASIQSLPLQQAYKAHLQDPTRKSMDQELALMRTMLDVLLSRFTVGMELSNVPMEQVSSITTMCKIITETVERMANVEAKMGLKLSVDQVTNLILGIVDKVITICPDLTKDQLARIADSVENIPILTPNPESVRANLSYGEGTQQGNKLSCATDKYIDDGTVIKNGFTQAEVLEHAAIIEAKFAPATAQYLASHPEDPRHKYQKKLTEAEQWKLDDKDVIDATPEDK
jgi:hypothetical protein